MTGFRRDSSIVSHLRIEYPNFFPGGLILFDKFEVPRILLVDVVIGHTAEDNMQTDVEFPVVHGAGERIAQNACTEIHLTRMAGQVLPAGVHELLSRVRGALEQGEKYIVNDHGTRLRHSTLREKS